MRFLAAFFLLVPLFASAAGGAAYAVLPSAGATFNTTSGISPVAIPFTFAPTAANDAVIGSKSIPVSVQTPYGAASGTVKTAGIFSKPVAVALAKGLVKLNLPLTVGTAIHDAYQAAGMQIQPDGTPFVSPPPGGGSWLYNGQPVFSSSICAGVAGFSCGSLPAPVLPTVPCGLSSGSCYSGSVPYYNSCCGLMGYLPVFMDAGAPPPAPATPAQKDAAVDAFVNANGTNAARAMSEAQSAGVPVPDTVVDSAAAPSPMIANTPWQSVGTQTDAAGNKQTVQKSATVEVTPQPGQPLSAPLPVKITENSQTINNTTNTVTNSSTNVQVNQAPNVTQSPAISPTNPVSDFCQQNPDAASCADVRTGGLPVEQIGKRTVDVSSNLGHFNFTGGASCPPDRALVTHGQTVLVSYKPFCDFLGIFRFAAIAVGLFVSGLIIMGQRSAGSD